MKFYRVAALFAATLGLAQAQELNIQMNAVDSNGVVKSIGSVAVSETGVGVDFKPSLEGLQPGEHGFHVHENASCDPKEKDGKMTAALAAGGHYDPQATKKHEGPAGNGHLGDLPRLKVGVDGKASESVSAARLTMADLKGRALIIHAGGDNYSDTPDPLGGGKARIACGVIQY